MGKTLHLQEVPPCRQPKLSLATASRSKSKQISYILFLVCLILSACQEQIAVPQVVVYTSVDQNFSEPILAEFERQSGIEVLAIYDVEAAKTTGMVNRLIAEKDHPQADVFWSGEFAQTIVLKEQGVLAPYDSPNAADIPAPYFDPQRYWTGFAGRARVILINKEMISEEAYPTSIYDLLDPRWPADKVGLAYPLFGTTSTHAAALYAELGTQAGKNYFEALQLNGIRVVDGNSVVRDMVAQGQLWFGLTDTDDACGALKRGAPVEIIFPDQGEDQLGTLVIPNTVALIADAPHSEQGKQFIDYLLSKEVEEQLVLSGWSHVPLRPLGITQDCLDTSELKGMPTDLETIYQQISFTLEEMKQIFIR